MEIGIIGFVGAFFLLSAWIYEAIHNYKKGEKLELKFVLAYIVGLSLLTYYTYEIRDVPLLVLNGAILFLTLIELELSLRQKPKRKEKR